MKQAATNLYVRWRSTDGIIVEDMRDACAACRYSIIVLQLKSTLWGVSSITETCSCGILCSPLTLVDLSYFRDGTVVGSRGETMDLSKIRNDAPGCVLCVVVNVEILEYLRTGGGQAFFSFVQINRRVVCF
jgi:hypothetical protein